jgi:acyl-CoA hydrolase
MVGFGHVGRVVLTASIIRLDLHHPVHVSELRVLRASVIFAGKTSMQIMVEANCPAEPSSEKRPGAGPDSIFRKHEGPAAGLTPGAGPDYG